MSLTLGNGFGNFRRPLKLSKEPEEPKPESNTPEIKGGMIADKPQMVKNPTIEYDAIAPKFTEESNTDGPTQHTYGGNGNSTWWNIFPGMSPVPDPEPEPTTVDVLSGDSLWKIARGQLGKGATNAQVLELVQNIIQANNLKDGNLIYPGQTLIIPD